MSTGVKSDAWQPLRQLTAARIALGRAGISIPTAAQLDFQLAHAQARDAVHLPLERARLLTEWQAAGYNVLSVRSAAGDRSEYLRRPDYGRQLHAECVATVAAQRGPYDVAVVIADGLSATAVNQHASALLAQLWPALQAQFTHLAPLVLVEQGRVAIADHIGQLLDAQQVVIILGERPGLSAPDSLGIYLTYAPQLGRQDSERNCLSNIRPQGMSFRLAVHKLLYLMQQAQQRQLSGVALKDQAPAPILDPAQAAAWLNDVSVNRE